LIEANTFDDNRQAIAATFDGRNEHYAYGNLVMPNAPGQEIASYLKIAKALRAIGLIPGLGLAPDSCLAAGRRSLRGGRGLQPLAHHHEQTPVKPRSARVDGSGITAAVTVPPVMFARKSTHPGVKLEQPVSASKPDTTA
jgi:hypothetical protein